VTKKAHTCTHGPQAFNSNALIMHFERHHC